MVAALLVFGLVIYHRALHLHFSCREVALEVLHVCSGVPEAPFGQREQLEAPCLLRHVAQRHLLHLAPCSERHEEEHAGLDSVLRSGDARVAHSVAAFVEVQRRLARLPSRRPHRASVVDVEISSAVVHRDVVVAVACDSAEFRVLIEGISSGRVGNQRKEVLVAQIVDPGPRRLRIRNDIFTIEVIEMTEASLLHLVCFLFLSASGVFLFAAGLSGVFADYGGDQGGKDEAYEGVGPGGGAVALYA